MELPDLTISSEVMHDWLTNLINEFIRVEKSQTGLEYQQQSYYVRGQIDVVTSLLNDKWNYKTTKRSYYSYLKYLVEKYSLEGVWRVKELGN